MTDTMGFIVDLLYGAAFFYIIGMFALSIFPEKRSASMLTKAGLLIALFIANTGFGFINGSVFDFNPNLPIFIALATDTTIAMILCKIKWRYAFVFALFAYSLTAFIDLLSAPFILKLFDATAELAQTPSVFRTTYIVVQCVTNFAMYRLVIFIKGKTVLGTQIKIVVVYIILFAILNVLWLFTDLSELYAPFDDALWAQAMLMFVFAIASLSFVLSAMYSRHIEKDKQLALTEEQLETQKEHTAQIIKKQEQIQRMSHDYRQHIHTLQGLIESGKYDEASNALNTLSQQQAGGVRITATGNAMIDALLSIKREIAGREGIECDWNIVIPPELHVAELDLCAVLGNALDNALEACRKLKGEPPFIKLDIHVVASDNGASGNGESDWLLCSIVNPVAEPPKVEKGVFITSKPDIEQHGLGLRSMKQCCENMGGNLEIFYDEKRFTVRFILPLNAVGA